MTVDSSRHHPKKLNGASEQKPADTAQDSARLLIENSYDFVAELDAQGAFVYVNPSSSATLGYDEPQLLGRSFAELIHPQDRNKGAKEFEQPDGTTILRLKHESGAWKWFDCSFRQFSRGEDKRMVIVLRDMTARREAQIKFEALASLGSRLSATHTLSEAAQVMADAAQLLCGWDAFAFQLYDSEKDQLYPVLLIDEIDGKKQCVPPQEKRSTPPPLVQALFKSGAQRVLRKGNDFDGSLQPFGDLKRASASLLLVPIMEEKTPVGLVSIQSYRINEYSRSDLNLLQILAGHCAGTLSRIRAVDRLKESQSRFRAFLEKTPGATWIKDELGRYIFANESFEELYSKTPGEVLEKTDLDFLPPELAARIQKEDARILRDQEPLQSEGGIDPADPKRWLIWKFPFLSLEGAAFLGGLGLEMSKIGIGSMAEPGHPRSRDFLDSLTAAVAVVRKGQLTWVNTAYKKVFQLAEDFPVEGRSFFDDIAPGSRQAVEESLFGSPAEGLIREIRAVRSGGGEFACLMQATPIALAEADAWLVLLLDISSKNDEESRNADSEKFQALCRLAGQVAREFANLFVVIHGHAVRLEQAPPNPGETLDAIIRAAERGTDFTRHLLAMGGQQPLQLSLLNLNQLVDSVAAPLKRLLAPRISVRWQLDPKLPVVRADREFLEQALWTLSGWLGEMIEGDGRITISSTTIPPGAFLEWPTGAAVVELTGNVAKLSEAELARLFEPFASNEPRLAAIFGALKQQKATLRAKNDSGSATILTLYFPAEPGRAGAPAPQASVKSRGTMLVVDPSSDLRLYLRNVASDAGFEVLEAATAGAARTVFSRARQQISAMVLDFALGEISGRGLVEEFRREKGAIKVLYLGSGSQATMGIGDLQPGEYFLPKPFSPAQLAQLLGKME